MRLWKEHPFLFLFLLFHLQELFKMNRSFSVCLSLLSVCISLSVCVCLSLSVSVSLYLSVFLSCSLPSPPLPPASLTPPSSPTVTRSIKTRAFSYKCNVSSSKWESVYLFQRSRLCSERFQSFHCEVIFRCCGIFF